MEDNRIGRSAHNVDEVWSQVQEDRRLSLDTRERVSSIEAKLDNLITSINVLSDKTYNKPQTNWLGIGTLIISFLIASGTYLNTRLVPTELDVYRHKEIIFNQESQISAAIRELHLNERFTRNLQEEVNRLKDENREVHTRLGRLEGKN